MYNLPQNSELPINTLSRCFDDVTNSYKFYWFLSILQELQENNNFEIPLKNLAFRMLSNVWYPLDYFKLSFGKSDGFKNISEYLSSIVEIDNSPGSPDLYKQIYSINSEVNKNSIYKKTYSLLKYVPYRFIRPFFSNELRGKKDYSVNKIIKDLSTKLLIKNKVLYSFKEKENTIIINPVWINYLHTNQIILRGFIKWNLLKFVQKNNPNVIGLSEKLEKPDIRDMRLAYKYWTNYLKENKVRCIFSKQNLTNTKMSIDHFLPWTYFAHDLIWNLAPTFKEINSSKGNNIPSYDNYFKSFVELQFDSFMYNINVMESKYLSDYCLLFNDNLDNISNYSFEKFFSKMKKYYLPQFQIAQNMGFNYGWKYA